MAGRGGRGAGVGRACWLSSDLEGLTGLLAGTGAWALAGPLAFPWLLSPAAGRPSAEVEQVKERSRGVGLRKGMGVGVGVGVGVGTGLPVPLLPSASWALESRMLGDKDPVSGHSGGSFLSILGDSCSLLGAGLGKELTDPYSGFSNISGLGSLGSSCGKGSRSPGLQSEKEETGETHGNGYWMPMGFSSGAGKIVWFWQRREAAVAQCCEALNATKLLTFK